MKFAISPAVVLVLASVGAVAAQQFQSAPREPSSSCVSNCGDSSGSTSSSRDSDDSARAGSRRASDRAWSLDEGMEYYRRADWDNAIRSFEEGLDKSPGDEEILSWLKKAKAAKARSANTDTSVVDARVQRAGAELVAKVPELARSPAADRIAKGFAAVITHDWPVVLAWWQDALNRDPKNAALKRGVDLARWMVDYRKRGGLQPTAKGARIDRARNTDDALRQLESFLDDALLSESIRFSESWLQR